jgi:hypothetical protein
MQRGKVAKRLLSWRVIAAVVAGMLAGSIIMTPAGAHITTSVKHLINKHIKKQFYTKKQSNSRFVLKTDSTALSGFKNGPGDVPSVPTVTQAEATIGTLALPAGNFAISAKLYLEDVEGPPDDTDVEVTCRLEAGADFDQSMATLFAGGAGFPWRSPISLQLAHAFPSPGNAVVKCRDDVPAPYTLTTFNFLRITAIEQGSASNVALP